MPTTGLAALLRPSAIIQLKNVEIFEMVWVAKPRFNFSIDTRKLATMCGFTLSREMICSSFRKPKTAQRMPSPSWIAIMRGGKSIQVPLGYTSEEPAAFCKIFIDEIVT